MFKKLICRIKGHKRGKQDGKSADGTKQHYRCPRCGATWTRKVKA